MGARVEVLPLDALAGHVIKGELLPGIIPVWKKA
jgi:hypothetical protein